ncbi:MAG: hypothetical protein KF884_10685 [Fimbriimonadaceae bacterium]|nr:hypothetical protein [Fimbriimonadaceae bacterium]QYK58012.1 MAG: hypothetical protein KF884_10685 [Fimbriimonadaceae bacterium]
MLGDTIGGDAAVLQDEEIDAALSAAPSFTEGVAQCAEACAAKVAQQPDSVQDETGFRAQWAETRIRTWLDLARRLRAGSVSPGPAVAFGPVGSVIPDHVEWPR